MARPMTNEHIDFLRIILEKGCRQKKSGYIYLVYRKKKHKRSRIIYELCNQVILERDDVIHHINQDREDDHISNLELKSVSDHISEHHAGTRGRCYKRRIKN